MSRSLRSLAVTSSVAVMVVAGSAPVAAGDASAARFAGAPADTSTPATATSVPSGYKIVVTNELTVASGTQAFATVTCPGTRRGPRYPMAGGVQILSSSLGANVSSTYPGGTSWAAYVNNASGAPTTFSVWAVCARPKSGYTVVQSASLPYPAGVQSQGFVACPAGTKILGGGATNTSAYLTDNMNSSYPLDNGWVVDQNNGSGVATTFQVYAVCSKYSTTTGYAVIAGPATDNPPGTDRAATVACLAGQSVLGGGIYSSSTSTADNINSTTPHTGSWSGFENNASTVDATIQAFAICAT